MVSWVDFAAAEPELAARAQALLDAGRHKTMATLRADGSPRISGTECEIVDGELTFGSMPGARKAADLHRDPRVAIHGPPSHPPRGEESSWGGEAKVAGRAVPTGELRDDDGNVHGEGFRLDLAEVVVTGLDESATMLVVEWWTPEAGRRRVERA